MVESQEKKEHPGGTRVGTRRGGHTAMPLVLPCSLHSRCLRHPTSPRPLFIRDWNEVPRPPSAPPPVCMDLRKVITDLLDRRVRLKKRVRAGGARGWGQGRRRWVAGQ